MINDFKIWFNRKNKMIFSVILGIIALILILQFLNNKAKKENNTEQIQNNVNETKVSESVNLNDSNTVLTGDKISDTQKTTLNKISEFINYCNEKDIDKAYDMLSDNCKNQLYPEKSVFEEAYYKKVFNGKTRRANIENWVNNIYKVSIEDDYLSTGKYTRGNGIQDYITIVGDKININEYIGKKEIKKSNENDNIKIEIEEVNKFMEYEIYKLKVTNKSKYTILLDDRKDVDAMYIKDQNDVEYHAYTHEITDSELTLDPRQTKEIEIKYYNKYGSDKEIEEMVFSRMILDNDAYQIYDDKTQYKYYSEFHIEIK